MEYVVNVGTVPLVDASGSGDLVLAPRRPNEERFNTKPVLPHYNGSEDCTLQTSSTELENTGGSFKICKYVEYVVNVGTVPLVDASGSGGLVLAPRRPNEERFNTKPGLPHYNGSEDCTLQTSSTELENTGGSFKICKYVVNVGTVPLVPHNAQCPIE